jgi:DNA modification methylase
MFRRSEVHDRFDPRREIVVYQGDCLDFLEEVPNNTLQLVVTSPPYNIGKEYEKRLDLNRYVEQQARVIAECARVLAPTGSICWQVGNYVDKGAIRQGRGVPAVPLVIVGIEP